MLGDASICLRRLQYGLDKTLPEGASEPRIIGTAYHGGLEAYYRARKDGEVIRLDQMIDAATESFDAAIPEGWESWDTDYITARCKMEKMLTAYATDERYWEYDHEVLEVEWRFDLQVPNTDLMISGTADLVLRDTTGKIVIADHKTSGKGWQKNKETPRHKEQAPMYLYAWFLATEEVGSFAYDVMSYEGKFDRRFVYPTTAEIMATVRKAQILSPIVELAKQGVELPGNTSHFLCGPKWCDYYAICPLGSAMDA